MKSTLQSPPRPITLSPEVIAKCGGPDQFEKFDRAFRAVIDVPKSVVLKEEARAKRRKNRAKKPS